MRRFLLLALLAMLVQSTLPYLTANCPLYQAGGEAQIASVHHAMADCPLMAMAHQASASTAASRDNGGKSPHDAHTMCPLCAVTSPLYAYVIAGQIALPPPPAAEAQPAVFPVSATVSPHLPAAAFSARAPPFPI